MFEGEKEIEEPRFNPEVLATVDNFEARLSLIMASRYGLKPEAFGTINDIISRYKDRKPGDRELGRIADSLKEPLSSLAAPGNFIDAQPNYFYGSLEVEVSKIKKTKPKEILTTGGEIWGILRPGRASRNDLLVVGPGRMEFTKPGIEIDCFDSSADPMRVPKGSLSIVSNEPAYGIPYGKIVIDAEEPMHHRNFIRITAIEDRQNLEIPVAVYASDHLGVEAYYDEKGIFKSLGIYFKEGGQSVFGIFTDGKASYHPIGNKKELTADEAELPTITINDGKITIERSGIKYSFEQVFDYQRVLDKVLQVLSEEKTVEI